MAMLTHRFHVVIEISGDTDDDYRVILTKYDRAIKNIKKIQGIDYVEHIGHSVGVRKLLSERKVT